MSDELVIRESPRVLLFSVGSDGAITHVDDDLLDEVASVLWEQLADHAYWGYDDAHGYEMVKLEERTALRAIARDALTPLLRRLVVAR